MSDVDADAVARLGAALADGLAAVHAAGLVYGRLTPAAIGTGPDGDAVLLDVDIVLSEASDDPEPGEFDAPETIRDGTRTSSSDLYALGAVLFAALSGRPPFARRMGESVGEHALRILHDAPVLDAEDSSAVAGGVRGLVMDLLSKDPDDRPADAGAVSRRLRALTGEPSAHPEPDPDAGALPSPPAALAAHRHRRLALVGAATVVAVGVGLAWWLVAPDPTVTPRPAADPPTSHPVAVTVNLAPARDHGSYVRLSWIGAAGWSYAVVIARDGRAAETRLVRTGRSYRVATAPRVPYCFAVQATDGRQVVESDPVAVRGAVCGTR